MDSWIVRSATISGYIFPRHAEKGDIERFKCPFGRYSGHMDSPSKTQSRAASIRDAIKQAGFTPFSLAEATGIPRTTLNRRLLGVSPFNTEELDAIAAALDTSVAELLIEDAA